MLRATVPATAIGMLLVVGIVSFGIETWLEENPWVVNAGCAIFAIYIMAIATRLWARAATAFEAAPRTSSVSPQFFQTLSVTSLNPNALLGALVFIPQFRMFQHFAVNTLTALMIFMACAALSAGVYTFLGGLIHQNVDSGSVKTAIIRSASACLIIFAFVIFVQSEISSNRFWYEYYFS